MTIQFEPDSEALRAAIIANADRHQFLGAGAGAGKTTTLVDHYFHLLAQGLSPAALVAVTFTEKAAAEMKQRLREKCRLQAVSADAAERPRWEALRHELEIAPISTIHGLCARLLRENALVAGLDPDFAVLDEVDAQLLLDEVVRQTLLSRLGHAPTADTLAVAFGYDAAVTHLLALVANRAQLATVLEDPAYDDPAALLAAWEGWLRGEQGGLLQRVLGHPEFAPNRDAVLTTRGPEGDKLEARRQEIAALMREHGLADCTAANLAPEHYDALLAGLAKLRRVNASNWGSAPAWQKAGLDKDEQLAAQCAFIHNDGFLAGFADDLQNLTRDAALDATCAGLTVALVAELRAASAAYREAKRVRSAVDFEDLMELVRDLWRDHPEALQRTRRGLRHLMIDEFQDTNTLQKQVLWPLVTGALEATTLPAGGPYLFVVGDAKQSIYRFRNADVAVFNSTRRELRAAAARDDELTRNFRSTESLIGVFNDLFGDPAVMGPEATADWEASYAAMQTHRAAPPAGQAPLEVHLLTDPKQSAAEGAEAGEETNLRALREREAKWLAGRLTHLLQSGTVQVQQGRDETWKPARPGDVALLFRSLTDVQLYERALREAGLPYYLVVGRGFFTAQEVQDVVHALRALENGLDDIALVGALRSPLFGLSDETLFWLGQLGQGSWWRRVQAAARPSPPPESGAAAAYIAGEQRERLQRAAALLADLQQRKNRLPLAALVQELLDRTGLPAVLAGQFGGRQLVSNVRKLVALAGEFEAGRQTQGQGSLRDFIEHLKRMTTEEVREGQAPVEEEAGDSIKLITYHSAKGLQWPIVVVPDLCRRPGGGFGAPYRWHRDLGLVAKTTRLQQGSEDTSYWPPPGRALKTRNDAEEEAESRRLFYVAATRAQDLLLLSGVTQLTQQGAVLSEAQQGPLGWLNRALGGPLWAQGGNEPGARCWRWAGHGLEESQEAVTSGTPWQRPGPAPATTAPDLDRLRAQLAPIAPANRGQWRFTATELSLYSHCPRLYELEVRLGLPGVTPAFTAQAEAGTLSPLELGTVVHRVLQLVGSGGRAALDEWVPEGATMLRLDTKLDKRAVAAIPQIRAQVLEFVASPLYAELFGGDTHLRSEALIAARLTVEGQPVIVEGKLDALVEDRATGKRHLLDYKTGEADPAKEAQYRVQLGLYCQAVQQATGSLPASARLLYLTRTGLKTVELDVPADTARAVEQAEAVITGLWRGEFPERAGQCEYCVGWRFCQPSATPEAPEEDEE